MGDRDMGAGGGWRVEGDAESKSWQLHSGPVSTHTHTHTHIHVYIYQRVSRGGCRVAPYPYTHIIYIYIYIYICMYVCMYT
jgi:hypothetical protein